MKKSPEELPVGIDIRRLSPELQQKLDRPGMEAIRSFLLDYPMRSSLGGGLDPQQPVLDIVEREEAPPFVEVIFNEVLRNGDRRPVRCTLSRRGFCPTVGVVMLTRDGRLVVMEEYRAQSGRTYLSIPSGSRKDVNESLIQTALTEGRAESLYEATRWTRIYELPPFAYHGAMLSMNETVVVITNVQKVRQLKLRDIPDPDEWIHRQRLVTPRQYAELLRRPPEGVLLHGPMLAAVGLAQAHGFFLPDKRFLASLRYVRSRLQAVTRRQFMESLRS